MTIRKWEIRSAKLELFSKTSEERSKNKKCKSEIKKLDIGGG